MADPTMTNFNCDFSTSSFTESGAYYKLLGFLEDINHHIIVRKKCKKNEKMINLLEHIDQIINGTKLEKGSFRFANGAAVKVHEKIEKIDLSKYFEAEKKYLVMLRNYLINSFGNKSRLDYGTGHEINFLAFLYILKHISILHDNQIKFLFKKYFQIIRQFIYKFNIEPAGSNGMFAVDDYSFLPFLFGSAENFHSQVTLDEILVHLDEIDNLDDKQGISKKSKIKSVEKSGKLDDPPANSDYVDNFQKNQPNNSNKIRNLDCPQTALAQMKPDPSQRGGIPEDSTGLKQLSIHIDPHNVSSHRDSETQNNNSAPTNSVTLASNVHSDTNLDESKENVNPLDGIYAEAIQFFSKHKCKLVSLPFSKHSPTLYSLRQLSWSQINEKMLEEVINKVLDRFVVMQHFIFCEVLPK